ncbi:MAG: hypothetical protein WKG01_26580 [Kofleriaceae bacterium]
MRNQMLLAAVASALIGCVGGIEDATPDPDPEPDPTDTPRDQFNKQVMPLMAQCQGCHTGPSTQTTSPFLGETIGAQEAYYNGIVDDRAVNGGWVPTAATLLTKGQHTGPAWTDTQAQTIAAWLTAEQLVRGIDTNPVPPTNPNTTARGAFMQWAQCLSVSEAEYEATGAYQISNMQTEVGNCASCHGGGPGGFLAMGTGQNQRKAMLLHWQEEVFIQGVFAANFSAATYTVGAAENKICNKGNEKDNNLGTHPSFNCNQDGLNRLKEFTTQVQAKLTAGGCGTPPAFKEPTPL